MQPASSNLSFVASPHVDGFGQIAEELVSHPCRAADWWLESNVMGGPY